MNFMREDITIYFRMRVEGAGGRVMRFRLISKSDLSASWGGVIFHDAGDVVLLPDMVARVAGSLIRGEGDKVFWLKL